MNICKAVREYLIAHPNSTKAELTAALGLPSKKINDAANLMWRNGLLAREGERGNLTYTVIRELQGVHSPTRVKQTEQERRMKRNAKRRQTDRPMHTFTSAPKKKEIVPDVRSFVFQTVVAPTNARRETVEEWMQRTGHRPEVLGTTNQFERLTPADIHPLTPAR